MSYSHFLVNTENFITQVSFNRPEKANSLPQEAWDEMKEIFEHLDGDLQTRVIILTGEGNNFCAGIDLSLLMNIQQLQQIDCEGRKRESLRMFIKKLQATITAIEKCRKPVLAAIHGACLGGGVDIISACDMRYASEEAVFSIREIDMGLVADIGTLQRLPHIISPGNMAELAYTGRDVAGQEAKEIGLVNAVYPDKETLLQGVEQIAEAIAEKSPLVIRGIKQNLLYSRDHTVEDALEYVATWNSAMILSDDLMEAFKAFMEKRKAKFEQT